MCQSVPQIGQNHILMARIGQKKPLLVRNGPKFSKNGQEQDFNKFHLEK